MRSTILATILASSILSLAVAQDASAASACKGLDNAACGAAQGCKWVPERIAGQTLTKKGEPSKTSAKAHCRAGKTETAQTEKK